MLPTLHAYHAFLEGRRKGGFPKEEGRLPKNAFTHGASCLALRAMVTVHGWKWHDETKCRKTQKTLHSSQKTSWSNVVPKFCVGPSTKLHLPNASHLLYFCTACADFEPKEVTCKNSHAHQQQTRLHGALRSSTQSIPQNDQIIQGPFHRSQDSNI